MTTQAEKVRALCKLHERGSAFIMPNPWDIGSAHVLAHMGFEALATTSMGYAFSIGKRDTGAAYEMRKTKVRLDVRLMPRIRVTSTRRFQVREIL